MLPPLLSFKVESPKKYSWLKICKGTYADTTTDQRKQMTFPYVEASIMSTLSMIDRDCDWTVTTTNQVEISYLSVAIT